MGNTAGSHAEAPAHELELRLAPLPIDAVRGWNGQPRRLLARVAAAGDEEAAAEARWDQAVTIQMPRAKPFVVISLFAVETAPHDFQVAEERLFTEVCLPYSGGGGLKELGVAAGRPAVPLQLALAPGIRCRGASPEELEEVWRRAREGAHQLDEPCLSLHVRELAESDAPAAAPEDAEWSLPTPRRQVVTLELQNAALKRQLLPDGPEHLAEEPNSQPSHVRQLHMIQQENVQIRGETERMQTRIDHTKVILAGGGTSSPIDDWTKTLQVMQQELEHCKERQQKIRTNYEERVAGLQAQLQWARRLPEADSETEMVEREVAAMRARIKEASLKNDGLLAQWQDAQRKAVSKPFMPMTGPLQDSPEVQGLRKQSRQNEAELEALRQELALQHEREQGTMHQQELRHTVGQLYEDLDEVHRARTDQRVRSESEVRELKAERDLVRDRLDDMVSEMQRLRSQAAALRAMRAQAESDLQPSVAELRALREENARRARALDELRKVEDARKETIAELEREQEELVEQISLKAMPMSSPELYIQALQEDP